MQVTQKMANNCKSIPQYNTVIKPPENDIQFTTKE